MKKHMDWYEFLAFLIVAVIIVLIWFGVSSYLELNGRVSALEGIDKLEEFSDKQAIIDYLKSERDFLIWMLGVIVSGALAVLAFFGLKTRKDAELVITEKYQNAFNEKLQHTLASEVEAKQKEILFLYQSNDYQRLQSTIVCLTAKGYCVKPRTAPALSTDLDSLKALLGDADIVVYQTSPLEALQNKGKADVSASSSVTVENATSQELLYPRIAKFATMQESYVFCILALVGLIQSQLPHLKTQ